MRPIVIAARIWLLTSLLFGAVWLSYSAIEHVLPLWSALPATLLALGGSLPVLVILLIALPHIKRTRVAVRQKILYLTMLCAGCCAVYGVLVGLMTGITGYGDQLTTVLVSIGVLLSGALFAVAVSLKRLTLFFSIENYSTLKSIIKWNQ